MAPHRLLAKKILNFFPIWVLTVIWRRLYFRFRALHFGLHKNNKDYLALHQFRRNIHRLEKGLSYPSPRKIFAESYIKDTVSLYKELHKKNSCATTLQWGEAVLTAYFSHCDRVQPIARAADRFSALTPKNTHPQCRPYSEKKRPPLSVSFEQFHELALRRRSVRLYQKKHVPSSEIEKAMRIAALSPSACNRQPFRFHFYNNQDVVNSISTIPGGVSNYTLPSIIIITSKYGAYEDEKDFNSPVIDGSLAAMTFQFALETLSLSSVCINWPNTTERELDIRKIISLDQDEFIIMLLGVGYADPEGFIPYSGKKELHQLLIHHSQ